MQPDQCSCVIFCIAQAAGRHRRSVTISYSSTYSVGIGGSWSTSHGTTALTTLHTSTPSLPISTSTASTILLTSKPTSTDQSGNIASVGLWVGSCWWNITWSSYRCHQHYCCCNTACIGTSFSLPGEGLSSLCSLSPGVP